LRGRLGRLADFLFVHANAAHEHQAAVVIGEHVDVGLERMRFSIIDLSIASTSVPISPYAVEICGLMLCWASMQT
jgi:hypothetical protein